MLDKNGNIIEIGASVWVVDIEQDLWVVESIKDKVCIKNTVNGNVIYIDPSKTLKHAKSGFSSPIP